MFMGGIFIMKKLQKPIKKEQKLVTLYLGETNNYKCG